MSELILPQESYQIIGACFEVYSEMGCGFLEAVYQESLEYEFEDRAIQFIARPPLKLHYKKRQLRAFYQPDFICFNKIVVEIKAASEFTDDHVAQVLNYLHATKYPLGILVNFGSYPKLKYKRIALTDRQSSSIRDNSRNSRASSE